MVFLAALSLWRALWLALWAPLRLFVGGPVWLGSSTLLGMVTLSSMCPGNPAGAGPLESRVPPLLLKHQPSRMSQAAVLDSIVGMVARSPRSLMEIIMRYLPRADDNITSSDIMRVHGYPTEGHFVYTEDGYRLRLDRVANPGRQPVYLAHGLQTGSPSFVLLGPGKSLSSMLHDAGYDVWMVNFRGTHHSQEHKRLSRDDEKFWRFSFHEHGVYDNTAAIDYVLQQTGFDAVLYAGHSMGCSSFLTMAATRPESQRRVRAAFLIAPAGPLHSHQSPFVGGLYAFNNITQPFVKKMRLYRSMGWLYPFLRRAAKVLNASSFFKPLIYFFTFTIVGFNPAATYYNLPYFFDAIPSGGSWDQVFHYVQNADPKLTGFRHFDHGEAKNVEIYGTPTPPEYDLSSIKTPIFDYLSQNDALVRGKDVEYLHSQLPNVVRTHYAKDPVFNHFDFFGSETAPWEIYRPLIADMQAFLSDEARSGQQR